MLSFSGRLHIPDAQGKPQKSDRGAGGEAAGKEAKPSRRAGGEPARGVASPQADGGGRAGRRGGRREQTRRAANITGVCNGWLQRKSDGERREPIEQNAHLWAGGEKRKAARWASLSCLIQRATIAKRRTRAILGRWSAILPEERRRCEGWCLQLCLRIVWFRAGVRR